MAASIDGVLHGERELDLDRMDEGELAILSSELQKMTARLTLAAEDLARERQSLADALADISHQIKTPLTSLSITTELVRKALVARGDCPVEVERLRRIERLQVRVEDLVAALLKLARLDAGTLALEARPVAVEDLIDRAVEPLAIALDIAGVAIERRIEPGCGFIGDAAWTAEALGNIVKNCMEHTPAGGVIAISAQEDLLACRLRVEDTGGGISEADLPHIFERFYRGAPAGASAAGSQGASAVNPAGIGIGLALARSLIVAQNGAVRASNVRDAGGRVTGARFDIVFFKDAAV